MQQIDTIFYLALCLFHIIDSGFWSKYLNVLELVVYLCLSYKISMYLNFKEKRLFYFRFSVNTLINKLMLELISI